MKYIRKVPTNEKDKGNSDREVYLVHKREDAGAGKLLLLTKRINYNHISR